MHFDNSGHVVGCVSMDIHDHFYNDWQCVCEESMTIMIIVDPDGKGRSDHRIDYEWVSEEVVNIVVGLVLLF